MDVVSTYIPKDGPRYRSFCKGKNVDLLNMQKVLGNYIENTSVIHVIL